MGCKCKEKTPEKSQVPCDEPEESFRQAYLRLLQENTKINAELNDTKRRLKITEDTARKYFRMISEKFEMMGGKLA